MEQAVEALIVLVLLGGAGDRDLGDLLAQELRERNDAATVLVGEVAHQTLEERWGIGVADLEASRQLGEQLTAHQDEVVILRLAGRDMHGDLVVDVELWDAGDYEHVTSIAGQGGDPVPGLLRALLPLLSERFPPAGGAAPAASAATADPASLVKRQAWRELLALLASRSELDAREHYYQVLAYARLGNPEAAIASHNRMRAVHGQHFLVAAAEDLLLPVAVAAEAEAQTPAAEPAASPEPGTSPEPGAPEAPPATGGLPEAPTLD